MVLGTKPQDAISSALPSSVGAPADWDTKVSTTEVWVEQERHAKVLEKGRPEGGWIGIPDKQVPLRDDQTCIPALLNQSGVKIRLTFKSDLRQLWLGSERSTQKLPYDSVRGMAAQGIPDHPGFSILRLALGSGASYLWLYWVPSQAVSGIKLRVLGVGALL